MTWWERRHTAEQQRVADRVRALIDLAHTGPPERPDAAVGRGTARDVRPDAPAAAGADGRPGPAPDGWSDARSVGVDPAATPAPAPAPGFGGWVPGVDPVPAPGRHAVPDRGRWDTAGPWRAAAPVGDPPDGDGSGPRRDDPWDVVSTADREVDPAAVPGPLGGGGSDPVPGATARRGPTPVSGGWRSRLPPVRLDPGRRGLAAVALVVVAVAAVGGGAVLHARPHPVPVASGVGSAVPAPGPGGGASPTDTGRAEAVPVAHHPAGTATAPAGAGATAAPAVVVIDVAGLVARPGVYRLPTGARVDDALAAAGGALPGADLTGLNRARVLADGEQVAVGVPAAAAAPTGAPRAAAGPAPSGATSTWGSTVPVDLNRADVAVLETLPGIGPVMAQRIVDYRSEHGRFGSVDELRRVSGVGTATFARLRDLVTV